MIPAIQFCQEDNQILVFSLSAKKLLSIAYFNSRIDDPKEGLQRTFSTKRSKQIAEYIDTYNSLMVNNIILCLNLSQMETAIDSIYCNGQLDIDKFESLLAEARQKELKKPSGQQNQMILDGKIAHIIDGQHRLRAFEYTEKDLPLVITALIDISLSQAAELFVKINYYQKPVNKSLALDLLGINKELFPEYCELHNVVERLNNSIDSPFYGEIKMLGEGTGFITQASLITAFEKYKIKDEFLEYELDYNEDVIYSVFSQYFLAVKKTFKNHWVRKGFLNNSLSIRAFIKALGAFLDALYNEDLELNEKNFVKLVSKIDMDKLSNIGKAYGGEKGIDQIKEFIISELGTGFYTKEDS